MLYKLFITLFLFASLGVFAQKKDTSKAKPEITLPKIDYTQIGSPMPQLRLITLDTFTKTVEKKGNWWSKIRHKNITTEKTNFLTEKDFNNDASLLIMMFNPTCSHCIEETENIKRNITLFTKTKVILMANKRMLEYLREFAKQRKIKDFPTITLGYDSTTEFINNTNVYRNLPQINIYSKERKLLKVYTGDVAIDSFKQYIQ